MKALFFFLVIFSQAWADSPQRVVLQTDAGPIVLKLYPEVAPETVKQFLKLVRLGVYDTTHFFRVHPGFVAQVSDASAREKPLSDAQRQAIHPMKGEFSATLRHHRGTLSMARWENDPNSATMSFSILLGDAPHLDGKYSIFGEVEYGFDALKWMQQAPRKDVFPLERINIQHALVSESFEELEKVLETSPKARTIASLELKGSQFLLWVLGWIGMVCLATSLFGKRFSSRTLTAFHLSNLLAVVFALLVTVGPLTANASYLGGALVIVLIATFRLFSRFEANT